MPEKNDGPRRANAIDSGMKKYRRQQRWSSAAQIVLSALLTCALHPLFAGAAGRSRATQPTDPRRPPTQPMIEQGRAATPRARSPESPNNPHVPTEPGPWFEGWYTRVMDSAGQRSIAVICASHLPKGEQYDPAASLPGYLNVLVCEGGAGAPTRSYVVLPERTTRTLNGGPVSSESSAAAPADFSWDAEGYGSVTENSIEIEIPGEISVRIYTRDPIPWRPRVPERGPEGILVHLPFPLHWHVSSLGSNADYTFTEITPEGPVTISGSGYAHQEKNWQEEFPLGWVWLQGIDLGNEAQIVASTADVALTDRVVFTPWILGYRSPAAKWDFRFTQPGTVWQATIDPDHGFCTMRVSDPWRRLELSAHADPGSFGPVAVPTPEGFVPERGAESFSAGLIVSLYQRDGADASAERLIERRLFQNAALEFGNRFASGLHLQGSPAPK